MPPARVGAKDEDDGYLVTFTINEATNRSECLIVDAKTMTEVCRLLLPHKLCSGTHSCWASREFIEKGVVA